MEKTLNKKIADTVTIQCTASMLGISPATVRNWVKCGHLHAVDGGSGFFSLSEVKKVKSRLGGGQLRKLHNRANKAGASRTFVPDEYVDSQADVGRVEAIASFIHAHDVDIRYALLLLSLNILKRDGFLEFLRNDGGVQWESLSFSHSQIAEEIKAWISDISSDTLETAYPFLLTCPVPVQQDSLGIIYQSIQTEGVKAQRGSYYTPSAIVCEIVQDYVKSDSKVLDPCCGTGQFLLAFADVVQDPSAIYGFDIDATAVRIARLNVLMKYRDKRFVPHISVKNTLVDFDRRDLFALGEQPADLFDVIATNPPWGSHFSKEAIGQLKAIYPEVSSQESYSYFLKKGIDLLADGGTLSYILPEAILNVKTHRDIREIILSTTCIKKISCLDRIFKNVFTPVIRLDLEKSRACGNRIQVKKGIENYLVEQLRWAKNPDCIFDLHINDRDSAILHKIYAGRHTTLGGQAEWALGIVTGDNGKFISDRYEAGCEEVYRGKDVEPFVLKHPTSYIRFVPERFQQVAPVEKYRVKEKLIYRFISKRLVFAYDDEQKLTLNSANILIPKIRNYPIKAIAALLNSSLYQFIFQKKFSSIKVLRSHLEQLPLPLWTGKVFDDILVMVDKIIDKQDVFEALDNYIMAMYSLSSQETNYIKELAA